MNIGNNSSVNTKGTSRALHSTFTRLVHRSQALSAARPWSARGSITRAPSARCDRFAGSVGIPVLWSQRISTLSAPGSSESARWDVPGWYRRLRAHRPRNAARGRMAPPPPHADARRTRSDHHRCNCNQWRIRAFRLLGKLSNDSGPGRPVPSVPPTKNRKLLGFGPLFFEMGQICVAKIK